MKPGFREATGEQSSRPRLAPRDLARGNQHHADVSLRRHTRPPGASGLQPDNATAGGMVSDRMAKRRAGTNEILAQHLARAYEPTRAGRHHESAMAHRARLPGSQTGARPRAL